MPYPDAINALQDTPTTGNLGSTTPTHIAHHQQLNAAIDELATQVRVIRTPEQDGAVGNARTLKISTTASNATATAVHPNPADNFVSGDTGKTIWIAGAGAAGALYTGTVTYASATTLTLSPSPSTTVASGKAVLGANDTTALQTWLDRAGLGIELRATPGKKYVHTGVIDVSDVDDVRINLIGAELVAVNENASEILFSNIDRLELFGGIVSCPMTTTRGNEYEDQKIRISGCTSVYWHHMSVQESMATGCYFESNDGFLIDTIQVMDTLADGIHIVSGSKNGNVTNCVGSNVGDDTVSIVSYDKDNPASLVRNVHVINCKSYYPSPAGRNFVIVGGDECGFTGCEAIGSRQASFYIAHEGGFDSHPVTRCYIKGGYSKDPVRNLVYDHPSLYLYNGMAGSVMRDVVIEGLELINSGNNTGSKAVKVGNDAGTGGTFSGIQLGTTNKPIKVTGTYWDTAYSSDVGATGITTNIELGPRAFKTVYVGYSLNVNPGALTAGAIPSAFTVTIAGLPALYNMVIGVDHDGTNGKSAGINWWGYTTAANTVTVYVQNVNPSGSITVGNGNLTVMVSAW